MTTEAADGVFIPNNADHWEVDTIDGDSTPSRITINGVEYRLVDPASMVVLDPESEADVDSVADAIRAHHKPSRLQVEVDWLAVQAALRSLLPAVTSPEPNGLGAVVVDADDEWVRTSGDKGAVAPWLSATEGEEERAWGHMRGPDVLSHGVGCACGAPDCNGGDQ